MKRKERDGNDNEDDEKLLCPIKVDPIPLDVEEEILTRLPAKSLTRFRCVSRMWSSIIRSQRFVDSYYAMSSATRSRFTIVFSNGVHAKSDVKRYLFISSSSHDEGDDSSSLVANLDMTLPSVNLAVVSTCLSVHGFLSCYFNRLFTICNPCTGQLVTLPCKGHLASLGYDPVDDQFKALTLVSTSTIHHHHDDDDGDGPLVHEVITIGGRGRGESRSEVTSPHYHPVTSRLYINGFVYFGAWSPRQGTNPVIVCFDVRYEKLSFIKAPKDVLLWEDDSILIGYNGKLASIVRKFPSFTSFDLWILEDAKEHDWSKQTFELPYTLAYMTSPGTNKAGEIIFALKQLSYHAQPFYIFYYNVDSKSIRRVRIHRIGDNLRFRRLYGFGDRCYVSISPQHVESIAYL